MALRYITVDEITFAVPETVQGFLTDDTPGGEFLQNSTLEHFAYAAEQEFESYVTGRYSLPVAATDGTIPVMVKDAILSIVKYKLYARRNALSPSIESQYNATLDWLKAISTGKASIPTIDADGAVSSDGNTQILVSAETETSFSYFV